MHLLEQCEQVAAHHGDRYQPFVWRFYASHRKALFRVIKTLEFHSITSDQVLIEAMNFIIAHEQDAKKFLEATIDLSFASKKWCKRQEDSEPSSADILAQGLDLEELSFLPRDITADFQRLSDKRLLSITRMNAALDRATEEDLRRASTRSDLLALFIEGFELMGVGPKILHSLLPDVNKPVLQALTLVFLLHLEKNGYADNMNTLLEVLRLQVPRFPTFQTLYLALEQELPAVAKELSTPKKLWGQIKNLSEQEREQYRARKNEHLSGVYLQHQAEIDAFWQRHPEIKNALEAGDPSSP